MTLEIFYYVVLFVLGLMVGSFINVVIYRFPRELSIITPGSACPSCEHRLSVIDLFPLLSPLFLRGRCRYCGVPISIRYSLVELLSGVFFVTIPYFQGFNLDSAASLFLLCLLLTISMIDIDYRRIPNVLLGIGLAAGILMKLADSILGNWDNWADAGLGMLAGGGIMLIIFLVSRGGMGAGDLKLMIMVGFFVGLQGVLLVLLAGFILGGIYGITMLLLKKLTRKDMVPFGPFLSLAVVVEVYWGTQIVSWYLGGAGLF